MKNQLIVLLAIMSIISACSKDDGDKPIVPPTNTPTAVNGWLVPSNQVFDGGPGKDGIPSIDNPSFSMASEANFLGDDDLVVGVVNGDIVKAYPHRILDWHEIVNDDIGSMSLAITYCPLTGTAVGWDRIIDDIKTEFGVSGKLYNTNLMPYDRLTDSYWSQIGLNCVNGELLSRRILTSAVIETKWSTWKSMYPNSQVMNLNTGYSRDYTVYPYGDYITNDSKLIFPVTPKDDRLPAKQRVLGVLTTAVNKVYKFDLFESPGIIVDDFGGKEIIVIGSKELNFMVAFENSLGLQELKINLENLPIIAEDTNGNLLTIDGTVKAGPLAGQELKATTSFIGFWFSFGAFYPNIEIY